MTTRERKEAKIEKRLDWAQGRRDKATALRTYTDRYHGDVAFNTQPGHIPERARVIGMIDRACEHVSMAATHESKAAGIQDQLDHSIYSDDEDAVGKIRERIAGLEAKRDKMKLVNALYKRGDVAGLAVIGLDLDKIKAKLAAAGPYWGGKPHLPYELTNLGGNIRRLQERIKTIEAAEHRTTIAEAAPGGVLIEGEAWVRVTFAEKPERAVIEARTRALTASLVEGLPTAVWCITLSGNVEIQNAAARRLAGALLEMHACGVVERIAGRPFMALSSQPEPEQERKAHGAERDEKPIARKALKPAARDLGAPDDVD